MFPPIKRSVAKDLSNLARPHKKFLKGLAIDPFYLCLFE